MKQLTLSFLLALLPMMASADAVEIDGIWYNLVPEAKEAEVTKTPNGSESYSGSIEIPTSVTYNEVKYSVTSIGEQAFYGCTALTSVTIPNFVTSIGLYAFEDCNGLTSVTIPNSVTSMGDYVFSGCNALSSVTIPNNLTSIGKAFSGCSGLISVTIPNSVTSIGDDAFRDCISLTSVTIPNSVTTIGTSAFFGCSSLTSIDIPNSVTDIAPFCFHYCSGLSSIKVESDNPKYDSRNDCNAIIETASNTLILGCKNTIIPNSVTSIEGKAFCWSAGMSSIIIPSSVTILGTYDSFMIECNDLISIKVESDNPKYDSRNDCNAIIETASNTLILGCKNTIIPNSVSYIGNYAFYNCSGLTSITIPNSVTYIGSSAFYGTEWYNNQNDGLIYLDNFLLGCKGTSPTGHIDIAEGTRGIAASAFGNCWGLTSVTIPNSVTSIGNDAFWCCSNLTSVTISNSVTSIGYETFARCSSLSSVTIPSSVTHIGYEAFSGCISLTSITIPNSVTSIDDYAFRNCSGLEDFYCFAEIVPTAYSFSFSGIPFFSTTLHVPAASLDTYKNTYPWSQFRNIVALTDDDPKPTRIKSLVEDSPNYPVDTYSIDGKRLQKEQRGLYIIRLKDGKTIKRFKSK